MTTTVRLPDGSTIDVQTDDPKQAAGAARKYWATIDPKAGPNRVDAFRRSVNDFDGNMIDNLIPNWGGELLRGIPAAAGALVTGKPVGEAFSKASRDFDADQEAYKTAHPTAHGVSATLGTVGSLALPAGKALKSAGLAMRSAQAAKVGAAYGLVNGAGRGDSVADRVDKAATDAVIGAGLGPLAPMLGKLGGFVGRKARYYIPGVDALALGAGNLASKALSATSSLMGRTLPKAPPRPTAAVREARRLAAAHMNTGEIQTGRGATPIPSTPEAVATELERRHAMGTRATPADIHPQLRNDAGWVHRAGPGQSMVRDALKKRKAEEGTRIRQHVTDELGDAVDPIAQGEEIAARAKAASGPAYAAAYNTPMVITPEIERIMATPAFQEAVPHAVRNIRNGLGDPTALGFRMDQHGNIEGATTLTTEGFDQVIRAMRDSGRAAADINPLTGKVVDNSNSVHINNRTRDLRTQLGEQNPDYQHAVANYADEMAVRDALGRGGDVGNLTGHEINAQARNTPDHAKEAWSVGARSAMADAASSRSAEYPTADTAGHVLKMLGDDTKHEAIGQMTGNTGGVRGLLDRLDAEQQNHQTWKSVLGNSATADRQANDQELNALVGDLSPGTFTMRGAIAKAINMAHEKSVTGFRGDVKTELGGILMEHDPVKFRGILSDIADSEGRRVQADLDSQRRGFRGAALMGEKLDPATDE